MIIHQATGCCRLFEEPTCKDKALKYNKHNMYIPEEVRGTIKLVKVKVSYIGC